MNPQRLTWIGRTDSGVVRQRLYDRDIGTLLLSPLDPGRKVWDEAIRKEGAHTGRFIDPHWYGLAADGNALRFRQVCDAACAELAPGEMLMVDLEQVSMDYVLRLFNGSPGNRGLVNSGRVGYGGTQEGRALAYTNEPFKNHTVVPMGVFSDCPDLTWYPQMYYGGMQPVAEAAVVLEIIRDYAAWVTHDDISQRVHPFRDGMRIVTDDRDVAYFTAERIPGVFTSSARFAARRIQMRRDYSYLTTPRERAAEELTKDSLRAHYTELAAA